MSAAASSANKGNVYNEENEALYDSHPGFTLPNFFTEIPWPEWNDAELNAEAWDEGKGRAATAAAGKKDLPGPAASVFDDFASPNLPLLISDSVCFWKRPQEVFENAILTVYDPTNGEFELTIPSAAADCDFFKSFNELLPILQFYAVKYGFPVELETPKFFPTTQGECWRPWHHVYALCKAGKGQTHKPLYCPYGKYVVRLFYMGIWRKIIVDDKIPCDFDGNCMLPTTQVAGELWPIILTKALLKIVSLTPTYDFSAADFPLLSFFTGWTLGSFTASNKTDEQIWRRFLALIPLYKLPEDGGKTEEEGSPSVRVVTSKKESGKDSRPNNEKKESQTEKFCLLLGTLEGFSEEENLFQNYVIALTMIRDCPLEKVNKRESTKLWKRIRWIYWAKEKGLWTDERLIPPYRRVQNITFAKELTEFLAPDPKQESLLYDIPEGEDEEEMSEDEKHFEVEQWCDFLKLKNHLCQIYVYFKPSFFNYNFKVTCLKEKSAEAAPTGKSPGKILSPPNFFSYPPILKPTNNEPLFAFCDSSEGIFLNISLSVIPKKPKEYLGYLDGDHPEVLKIGHGSLIVENFSWWIPQQGEIIGTVKTVGNSSLALNLKPGRHILKIWLNSDSPYVIDVYSNVNVVVQKSPRIRFLMTKESERIVNYVSNVSNAFIALTLKFGKPDLPAALREFYSSIRPGNDSMIGYHKKLDDFIETFLTSLMLSLKDLIPNVDELKIMMWALQSLFFNPNIRCDLPSGPPPSSIYGSAKKPPPPKKVVAVVVERTLSQILEYPWTTEEIKKIILIQRIFRGFRVRLLWKVQMPSRKEFKPYVERLKKICDTIFVPLKREQEVGQLIRKIVMAKPDLLPTFRFYKDFFNVVQLEEYNGKLPNVEPFAWIPITRFVVACHTDHLVPCAFYFSCNLESFVIQGIDNDTNQEIFRLTNNVFPYYYHNNVSGYTIFAYGWNECNFKTVNWKLELMKLKYFQTVHLCNIIVDFTCRPYTMPSLDVLEVKNFYIPNSKNKICRCFIKIQKRTLLTLRFSTSYSDVHFVLTISLDKNVCASDSENDASGKIIKKISANGAVMVSSLILEYVESPWCGESYTETESTTYIVEVFVLDKSWPLTKQEWGVVEPLRINGENWKGSTTSLQSRKVGADSRKKLTRVSKRSVHEQKVTENPFWWLQVLNDTTASDTGESISVEEDRSYFESIKAMKLSWEEKDPGRRKRGKEMRMKFLYMIFLEEKKNLFGEGGEYLGEYDTDRGNEDIQVLIDRLSSFSYLTNNTSPTRYTQSPRTLPIVPLFSLLCKYCRLKKSMSEATEDSEFITEMSDFSGKFSKNLFEELDDEMRDFLNQCAHFRSVMINHTNEELKLSSKLLEQAYEKRSKVIERMMR